MYGNYRAAPIALQALIDAPRRVERLVNDLRLDYAP
jgi:hypothetical protein